MSTVQRTEASYRLKFFLMLNKISVHSTGEIDYVSTLLQAFLKNQYIHTNGHSSLLERTVMQLQTMKDCPEEHVVKNFPISNERFRGILIEEVKEKFKQIESIKCKIEKKEKKFERYLTENGVCYSEAACIFPYMDDIMELIEQDLIPSITDLLYAKAKNDVFLANGECLVYLLGFRLNDFKLLLQIGIPCREIVRLDLETIVKILNNINNISELIKKGEEFSNIANLFLNEFSIEEIYYLSTCDDNFMEWFVLNVDHIKALKQRQYPFESIIELLDRSIPFLEQGVKFEEIINIFDENCDVLDTIFDHTPIMIKLLNAGMTFNQFALIQQRNLRLDILDNSYEIIKLLQFDEVTFDDLLEANRNCLNKFLSSRDTMNSVINLANLGIPAKKIIFHENHKISRVLITYCGDMLEKLNPIEIPEGFKRVVDYLERKIDETFFDDEEFIRVIEDK